MTEKQGSWYLLTGLLLGIAIGLIISLFLLPARYIDVDPSVLGSKGRDTYRSLVAKAFLAEGNTPRALSRLALLKDENPADELNEQAQRILSKDGDQAAARALVLLAAAVNQPALRITPLPLFQNTAVTETP